MNPRLYYPAKPYVITQGWGILNPSYNQFGFSKHNGQDFLIGKDNLTHCPLKSEVVEAGYDQYKGYFVRLISVDEFIFNGQRCKIGMVFMHHEKILCKTGDILDVGGVMGIPDNTGFSTGPHTHGSYYHLGLNAGQWNLRLDTDTATNNTFDPQPFWSGYHAQDYGVLIKLQQGLVGLLQQLLSLKK